MREFDYIILTPEDWSWYVDSCSTPMEFSEGKLVRSFSSAEHIIRQRSVDGIPIIVAAADVRDDLAKALAGAGFKVGDIRRKEMTNAQ